MKKLGPSNHYSKQQLLVLSLNKVVLLLYSNYNLSLPAQLTVPVHLPLPATGVYYVGDETIATAEIVGLEVYTDGDTFVPSSEQVTIVYSEDGTFTVTITVPGELGLGDDSYLDLTVYFETTVGGGAPSQGINTLNLLHQVYQKNQNQKVA